MASKKYDYIIVGSGLFGATFAYKSREAGKRCLVIEKRQHLGGNIYCEQTEGINVHKYGAHIFHTSNKEVWDFVNSLVPFNRYTNSPVANYKGKLYNLPFNMNTFYQMWGVTTPEEAQAKIEEQKKSLALALSQREGSKEPTNLEEQAISLVGEDIYNILIKEYTEKQWGRDCKDLPAFIIKRLPLRFTFDNNYFNDKYQGIPVGGYNILTSKLLEGCDCITDCDFFNDGIVMNGTIEVIHGSTCLKDHWQDLASSLVYSGALDEYFDYSLGRLDWRTVDFNTRIEDTPNYQGNAVVNYTSHEKPFTRVIEHKHFEMFGQEIYDCPKTVISEEYSTEYIPGKEPYYPVNDEKNNKLAVSYRQLAHENGILFPEDSNIPAHSGTLPMGERGCRKRVSILFGGRLAEYKYYDMAPVIEKVLNMFKTE